MSDQETTESKRRVLSPGERFAMLKDLEQALVKHPDGKFSYIPGFSDATIAEKHGIATLAVRRARDDVFGELLPTDAGTELEGLRKRVGAYERELFEMSRRLLVVEEATARIKGLTDAVNRHSSRLTGIDETLAAQHTRIAALEIHEIHSGRSHDGPPPAPQPDGWPQATTMPLPEERPDAPDGEV